MEIMNNELHDAHMTENEQQQPKTQAAITQELFEAFGLGERFNDEKELRAALAEAVAALPSSESNDMIKRKIDRAFATMDEEAQQLVHYIGAVTHEMQEKNVGPQDPHAREFLWRAGVAQRILLDRNIETLKELQRLIAPSKKTK